MHWAQQATRRSRVSVRKRWFKGQQRDYRNRNAAKIGWQLKERGRQFWRTRGRNCYSLYESVNFTPHFHVHLLLLFLPPSFSLLHTSCLQHFLQSAASYTVTIKTMHLANPFCYNASMHWEKLQKKRSTDQYSLMLHLQRASDCTQYHTLDVLMMPLYVTLAVCHCPAAGRYSPWCLLNS